VCCCHRSGVLPFFQPLPSSDESVLLCPLSNTGAYATVSLTALIGAIVLVATLRRWWASTPFKALLADMMASRPRKGDRMMEGDGDAFVSLPTSATDKRAASSRGPSVGAAAASPLWIKLADSFALQPNLARLLAMKVGGCVSSSSCADARTYACVPERSSPPTL
jgi:hypothetical protein